MTGPSAGVVPRAHGDFHRSRVGWLGERQAGVGCRQLLDAV
jgi:hypothetical protein